MKTNKLTAEEQVKDYFAKLDHPLKEAAEALRAGILSADKEIGEQIKWNSPAFYYTGEMKAFDPREYKRDIVVFNLHKKDVLLLVFPTGAKIKDTRGILEWKYPEGRKIAEFASLDEVKMKEKALREVIKEWLSLVEK